MANLFESHRRALHREIWSLIPWLVNGSLDEAQSRRCEAHLDECDDCRAEYRAQRSLQQQIQSTESVIHTPHAGLRKLMERIDSDDSAPPVATVRAEPRRVRWLAAAVVIQTVGLVSLAGFTWSRLNDIREAPRYVTLSSTPVSTASGPAARVVFSDSILLADFAALLHSSNAQIVAGPSEAGVYTLVFPGTDRDGVAATIARLRTDPHVQFAELVETRARP
ncbi:MAG TPA: zf-HC2 domain-containing protein [Povalibacter sp.]